MTEKQVIAALLTVLLLVSGWLYALIIDLQRETRSEVEAVAVQVARLEAILDNCK